MSTPAEFISGLKPDGTLPAATEAQVQAMISAKVDPLAAITITGAGRPDQPATLTTPGTADLVAAADAGTVFRSLDGAGVGAWEWAKRGGSWVETDADTGWLRLPAGNVLLPVTGPHAVWIRRKSRVVYLSVDVLSLDGSHPVFSDFILVPVGFRPSRNWRFQSYEAGKLYFNGPLDRLQLGQALPLAGTPSQRFVASWPTDNVLPTSLVL